jgi:aromatic ring-opening dioxygenase LigB subunit
MYKVSKSEWLRLQKISVTYSIDDAEYMSVDTSYGTYEMLRGFREEVTESLAENLRDLLDLDFDIVCEEF